MTQAMIEAKHLVKSFNVGNEHLTILKGINLTIQTGQFVGIMGPSGSGKSTLLYLLGGLDHPTQGDIYVNNYQISQLNDEQLAGFRSQTIGFVFQAFHLIPTLTAIENVGLPGVFPGIPRAVRNERAFQLLKALGLGERASHRPSQLSGGQQQRVAIARALFNAPPILMCDEPTGALDSKTGHAVMRLLQTLAHKQNKTIVVVTHDPGIADYADRMVHFNDGNVIDDYLTRDRKEPENVA